MDWRRGKGAGEAESTVFMCKGSPAGLWGAARPHWGHVLQEGLPGL